MEDTSQNGALKNMEFTPIGYMKEKQAHHTEDNAISPRRLDMVNSSKIRDRSILENENDADDGPLRKQSRSHASMQRDTSIRLFNDASQFDDTLPEIIISQGKKNQNNTINNATINNVNELNENTKFSNPIRQQEEQNNTYLRAISILKLKNTTLINLLKDEDPSKLDTNLKLIDDFTRERDKNDLLMKDNVSLQNKIKSLSDQLNNMNHSDDDDDTNTNIHEECLNEKERLQNDLQLNEKEISNLNLKIKDLLLQNKKMNLGTNNKDELKSLQDKLNLALEREKNYKIQIDDLQSRLNKSIDDLKYKESHYTLELNNLQSKINESTILLTNRETEYKSNINDLENRLKESNIKFDQLEKEYNEKYSNIENNLNQKNQNSLNSLRNTLDEKNNEIKSLEIKLNNNKTLLSKTQDDLEKMNNKYNELAKDFKDYQTHTDEKIEVITNNDSKQNSKHSQEINKIKKEYDSKLLSLQNDYNILQDRFKESEINRDKLRETLNKDKLNFDKIVSENNNEKNNLQDKLNENDTNINALQSTIKELEKLINDKESELTEKSNEYRQLMNQIQANKLESNNINEISHELRVNKSKLNRISSLLTDKENELKETIQQLTVSNNQINKLKTEISSRERKIDDLRHKTKSLENQLFKKTIKTSDETLQVVKSKNIEIENLQLTIDDLKKDLDESLKTNNLLEQKIDKKYQHKIQDYKDEISLLNQAIKSKIDENEKMNDRLRNEINDWRDRYTTLNDTFQEQLSKQSTETNKDIGTFTREKNELLKALNNAEDELNKWKIQNKDLFNENKQLREYLKSSSKLSNGFDRLMNKYSDMKKTYTERVTRLESDNLELEEQLQREKINNLSRGSGIAETSALRNEKDNNINNILQDRSDYYKLKYNQEVIHNNDLRIMNDYLNRVLRATTQKMRTDVRRIKRELSSTTSVSSPTLVDYENDKHPYLNRYEMSSPSSSSRYGNEGNYNNNIDASAYYSNTYPYDYGYTSPSSSYNNRFRNPISRNRRLIARQRFKTLALMVKACVRMRHVAIKHNWDNERINYLKKKLRTVDASSTNSMNDYENDRISW